MTQMPQKVVLITAPEGIAEELAKEVVEGHLAACVQVFAGGLSFFRWDGEVQAERESLLICKTTSDRIDDLTRLMTLRHPYEVPELLVLPVEAGLPAYLSWMVEETSPYRT
ncbi:MAG: divalent-cation tolerance protein CutA [Spirochaetaceae bacterium]|nr:MAG: divalent-cation tolerance protein CutA [Spirochaetaceae bacterium]